MTGLPDDVAVRKALSDECLRIVREYGDDRPDQQLQCLMLPMWAVKGCAALHPQQGSLKPAEDVERAIRALREIMVYVNRGHIEGDCTFCVAALEEGEQALAALSTPSGEASTGDEDEARQKLGYHGMGSSGRCDWTHLREPLQKSQELPRSLIDHETFNRATAHVACMKAVQADPIAALARLQSSSIGDVDRMREALERIERVMRDNIHENDGPDRVWLDGVAHEGPLASWAIRCFRKVGEIASAALNSRKDVK